MAGFKKLVQDGIKAYHVWPVAFLAFLVGPGLAVYQSAHQINGPDCRVLKNFDTNDQFEKKQFKYLSSVDHGMIFFCFNFLWVFIVFYPKIATYEHPRPRF